MEGTSSGRVHALDKIRLDSKKVLQFKVPKSDAGREEGPDSIARPKIYVGSRTGKYVKLTGYIIYLFGRPRR